MYSLTGLFPVKLETKHERIAVLALIRPAYFELHFMVFFSAGFLFSFAEIDQFPFGRRTIKNV